MILGRQFRHFHLGCQRCLLAILAAAALILLIRWIYWLIRRHEGIGLGDAKLMALLAAWLGLPGALARLWLGSRSWWRSSPLSSLLFRRCAETPRHGR